MSSRLALLSQCHHIVDDSIHTNCTDWWSLHRLHSAWVSFRFHLSAFRYDTPHQSRLQLDTHTVPPVGETLQVQGCVVQHAALQSVRAVDLARAVV
jgi:hypothetical protein